MARNIFGATLTELGDRLNKKTLYDLHNVLQVDGIYVTPENTYDYNYGPIDIEFNIEDGKKYYNIRIRKKMFPRISAKKFAKAIVNKMLGISIINNN